MDAKQVTAPEKKELVSILNDPVVAALIKKTHAQIDTWVDANITAEASLKSLIKKILYVVKCVLNEKR